MKRTASMTLRVLSVLTALSVLNSGCGVIEDILRALGRACETTDWTVTRGEEPAPATCTPEDCSLRLAITISNACPGVQTLHLGVGVYDLARSGAGEERNRSGDLDITDSVNIIGSTLGGYAVVDANGLDRVFDIKTGTTVRITDLVIRNGSVAGDGAGILNDGTLSLDGIDFDNNVAGPGGGRLGGAIANRGDLSMAYVYFYQNRAAVGGAIANTGTLTAEYLDVQENSADGAGGGLANQGSATIAHSGFVGNRQMNPDGGGGGGMENDPGATLTVTNSTVSGNEAAAVGSGIANTGSLQLGYSTIADNIGDGINLSSLSTAVISNSIVADNSGPECLFAGAPLTSGGFNLDSGHGCGFDGPGDLTDTDPLLLAAGYNGGFSLVHALDPASPAIDSADLNSCPPDDQRNRARPFDGDGDGVAACDRGAYEYATASTSAPIVAATATPTPAPEAIPFILILNRNSNCRLGPGTAYEAVDAFPEGQSLVVDGQSEMAPLWWQIQLPTNAKKHCWISSASGKPTGDLSLLAVIHVEAPPKPPVGGPGAPAAPSKVAITGRVCTSSKYSVTIGWHDNANNETGYHVYRDGALIATLGANATSYTDNPPGSGPYTYSIEAYNATGVSVQVDVNEEGCLI